MKKIYVFLLLCLCFFYSDEVRAQVNGEKWSFDKLDTVLTQLLSISYNDPFLTPSIRQDYLKLAIKRVSATISLKPYKVEVVIDSGLSIQDVLPEWTVRILAIQRYVGTSSVYSLTRVSLKDMGHGELSTSISCQFYDWLSSPTGNDQLSVYPAELSGPCTLTVYGEQMDTLFANIRHIGNDIILHFALYRCYLQKGEFQIAGSLKQVADAQLFDLQNVLENRLIDITVKGKVLSK